MDISPQPGEVTALLQAWSNGDGNALAQLVPLVENELSRVARAYLRRERDAITLQTASLVNEAYIKLIQSDHIAWQDRAHFFGLSARLMRQILVDHARRQNREKHGAGALRVTLGAAENTADERDTDFLAVDMALEKLAAFDPRKAELVELRFFGGLTIEETAEVMKLSVSTIGREWSLAQAWLFRELS
ncbi:MAG: sigma-70 family RNA polymerase sigma factor [Blastocatellia bacterium]